MGQDDSAPVPIRLENGPESSELLDCILDLIKNARTRVWLKVAWWNTKSDAGRDLGRALVDAHQRGVDTRVIMRNDADGLPTISRLRKTGIEVRPSRYIHEKELLVDDEYLVHSMNFTGAETERNTQVGHLSKDKAQVDANVARFVDVWEQLAAIEFQRGVQESVATKTVVPEGWLPLLEYTSLNPFQADVAPAVLQATGHTIVVAPTGAGKSLIGELALLRAVKMDKRKGVWLVPSRALAGELSRLRTRWAERGINVEVLTGETNLSSERLKKADIWIATTEKFESLCRRTSLQDAVADVACIVVDEIHLIGDPTRGSTLEALLARLRFLSDNTRIVGLSATVTNAEDLADWLGAQLLRSTWRPTVLITQLIEYHADGDSWKDVERAKDEKLMELVRDLRVEASPESEHSSILIFVGSKNSAKSVAARIAEISDAVGDVALAQQCLERGVGFHYRGAPEGQTTLGKFNTREIGILVATSGLATGVNTPARAVIVRDLTLGTSPIEVSQLQQMFGRAGRAGHESDGYAYVLIPEGDHASWQQRLAAGYRVDSKLAGKEADAALAEIHLGNISTAEELELWYSTTLAAAQVGAPLSAREVIKRLTYASLVKEDETGVVAITDLGRLTVQLMVDVASASAIRKELGVSTPTSADEAERLVLQAVCRGATALANRPVNPKPWDVPISTVMARHHIAEGWGEFGSRLSLMACYAALEQGGSNVVAELALRDVLDEAPRYFTWVGELGRLGYTSWPAIVATDIGERLNNYRLSNPKPARGSGRVLKFLRAIVEPDQVDAFIKDRWRPTSGIRLPELFPTQPVDDRVLPANLSTAHQGVLRTNIPRCEVLEGVLEVEIGIEGVIERSETFANSGMAVVHATGSQGSHVSMPIPSGAARCQQVALEVIAFSRSDATYNSVISNVSIMLREEDLLGQRQAAARKMLPDVRDTALVYAGKERRSMFRKKREQAELDNLRALGDNSGLGPVSYELTNGLEPLLAVWSIREAISAICSNATSGLFPRSPAAVLRSGTASGKELALVRYALIKEAGLQAELVAVGDLTHLHCAVRLGDAYFVLDDELPQGRIIRLGVGRALALSTLPPRPAEPAVEATLRMGWLSEFLENRPDQLAAED